VGSFGRRQFRVAALSAFLVLGIATGARAETTDASRLDTARSLANRAADAYAERRYADAHALCQRAYALVPAPTISLLDARSLVRLDRWVEALEAYERALKAPLDPRAPDAFRSAVKEAELERAVLQPRVPRLKVVVESSTRSSISVLLDGRRIPATPIGSWIPADPRPHTLEVSVDGEVLASRRIALRPSETRVVNVRAPNDQGSDSLRPWGYAGLGLAGAGLAAGVVTGVLAVDAHDEATQACPEQRCREGSEGADALDRFRTYRAISTVGYAVGAAAAVAGTLILVRSGSRTQPELAISASAAGIRLVGSL
jgi:hypothetical protein